jgi:hypothetical protein
VERNLGTATAIALEPPLERTHAIPAAIVAAATAAVAIVATAAEVATAAAGGVTAGEAMVAEVAVGVEVVVGAVAAEANLRLRIDPFLVG